MTGVVACLTGCAALMGGKPYLTERAFDRAAAACHVVPQGVHHSRGGRTPFAMYKLDGAAAGEDHSHECLAGALRDYRFDFFGEDVAPDER